jgi:hypothetical protein
VVSEGRGGRQYGRPRKSRLTQGEDGQVKPDRKNRTDQIKSPAIEKWRGFLFTGVFEEIERLREAPKDIDLSRQFGRVKL